jgi:hypothetical protein
MYAHCPKCDHAPLPLDQSFPAACPACGVILAKVGMAVARARGAAASRRGSTAAPRHPVEVTGATIDDEAGDGETRIARLHALLFAVPERVDAWRWRFRCALWAGLAFWGLVLIALDHRDGAIGRSVLHGPLLVFHEAGHVLFALLGEWMRVAGGTLGQLLMPLVIALALLMKNRDPFGASLGLWLFGVSLLDVAPYVYDALQPQLTLLSGGTGEAGGHDWIYLLRSMGLLQQAQRLGGLVRALGAGVLLLALAWGGLLLVRQRGRIAPGLPDERVDA